MTCYSKLDHFILSLVIVIKFEKKKTSLQKDTHQIKGYVSLMLKGSLCFSPFTDFLHHLYPNLSFSWSSPLSHYSFSPPSYPILFALAICPPSSPSNFPDWFSLNGHQGLHKQKTQSFVLSANLEKKVKATRPFFLLIGQQSHRRLNDGL